MDRIIDLEKLRCSKCNGTLTHTSTRIPKHFILECEKCKIEAKVKVDFDVIDGENIYKVEEADKKLLNLWNKLNKKSSN